MKRVIALNASNRKKNTYHILEILKDKLIKFDIDMDIVNLNELNINKCTGCEGCLRNDICYLNDDANSIMKRIIEYDGIVISSPVYMNNVSGILKVFLDRTCKWVHRPELASVPVMYVATTAGSGIKSTLDYMENVTLQWGGIPTSKIGRNAGSIKRDIGENEFAKFVKCIYMDKSKYRASMKELLNFQVKKILAEKVLPNDKEYWKKKQWLDKYYYFNTNINPIKKTAAATFYKLLSKKIRKTEE